MLCMLLIICCMLAAVGALAGAAAGEGMWPRNPSAPGTRWSTGPPTRLRPASGKGAAAGRPGGGDDPRRFGQLGGGLDLALGGDHLGPAFALGLRLAGHCRLRLQGQLDVLQLDRGHLDAPLLGAGVQDVAHLVVDAVPVRQDVVQLHLAHHGTQGRGRQLQRGRHVIVHLQDGVPDRGPRRVDHGANHDRDVVPGNDLLGRDLDGLDAGVDHPGPVDIRTATTGPSPVPPGSAGRAPGETPRPARTPAGPSGP